MDNPLHDITLKNFRSYTESSFEFDGGVNIIVGPNASGKTNILEAIHCICFGKGFKGSEQAMIRQGENWLRIESRIGDKERAFTLKRDPSEARVKKNIIIDNKQTPRLKIDDAIPIVLFEPDDLRLTNGSPKRRRDYIDKLLMQTVVGYKTDLLAYERVLKQRNSALKYDGIDSSQFFAWNVQLADRGSKIVKERYRIIAEINDKISDVYSSVAGGKYKVGVDYNSSLPASYYPEKFLKNLENNLNSDRAKGITSIGPHRDDIVFKINDKKMKEVASRGENRTLVLALKIIELGILENVRQRKPIILLDDVFSELDGLRRRMLTAHLSNHQSILTTTDADVVGKSMSKDSRIIAI